jgi:hypothetical protein
MLPYNIPVIIAAVGMLGAGASMLAAQNEIVRDGRLKAAA